MWTTVLKQSDDVPQRVELWEWLGENDVNIVSDQSTPNISGSPDGQEWNMSLLDTIKGEAKLLFVALRLLRNQFIKLKNGGEDVNQVHVDELARALACFRKSQSSLKTWTDGHPCGWEVELVPTGETLKDRHFRIMETTAQRLHQMGVQDHGTIIFPPNPEGHQTNGPTCKNQ